MPSDTEKPAIRYDAILVSSRGVAETHGKKVVILVPTAEIERITLKFGRPEHRPAVSLCIGGIFALIGVVGVIEFFRSMRGYRYELGMIAFGIIGTTIIIDALKERHFLEVQMKNNVRRLVFSKKARKKEIDEFCDQVRSAYKYPIAGSADAPA